MTTRRTRSTPAASGGRRKAPELVRRVAVYTRRSTDEEHQPYSIQAQTLRLDAYITSQPGWVKTATFTDNASAKDTHRPGLRAALAAAHSGRIDVLLVLKVDRFSRRQRDLVALVEELTGLGVAFVSATEAFDTSTPAGRAMLQMLGTFAEFEREMIIDRVVAGMERHAAAGRWPGGVRPDGYRLDPTSKRLVIDEERAPIVREIFDLYTHKRLGTRAIANRLNERGSRTRTGGPWSAHTIRWLLTNPTYLGQVSFRDTIVQNAHPAVIDQATFDAAQWLLAARGEARTHRAANASEYHLTGRIRCPHCHKGFIGTAAHGRTKAYRYYTCWTRSRYGTTTCNADRINADAADTALFANLAAFYRDHRDLIADAANAADTARHAATDRHRAELTAVEKEITRTGTAIDRYLVAFEDNTLEPALLQERLTTLRAKTTQLQARRDELTGLLDQAPTAPSDDELDTIADHIDDVLNRGTPAQRKALIEQLVEEIQIIGPSHIRPIYRIPHREPANEATPNDGTTVRAMGNLVALTAQLSKLSDKLASLEQRTNQLLQEAGARATPPAVVPRRKQERRFSADEMAQVAERYLTGLSVNQVAREFGVHRNTVVRSLKVCQVNQRLAGLRPEDVNEAAALYEAGWSAARLGEKYNCGAETVRITLIRHGIRMRPRNRRNLMK